MQELGSASCISVIPYKNSTLTKACRHINEMQFIVCHGHFASGKVTLVSSTNSTTAKTVKECPPALTFVAGSPVADIDEPPDASQEFLALVLFVLLNTQTQFAPSLSFFSSTATAGTEVNTS